jgi:hypothetical protein
VIIGSVYYEYKYSHHFSFWLCFLFKEVVTKELKFWIDGSDSKGMVNDKVLTVWQDKWGKILAKLPT